MLTAHHPDSDEQYGQQHPEIIQKTSLGRAWFGKIPVHPYEEERLNERKRVQTARNLLKSIDDFLATFDDTDMVHGSNASHDQLNRNDMHEKNLDSGAQTIKAKQDRHVKDPANHVSYAGTTAGQKLHERKHNEDDHSNFLLVVSRIVHSAQEWLPFLPIQLVATSTVNVMLTLAERILGYEYKPSFAQFKARLIILRAELRAVLQHAGEASSDDEVPYDLLGLPFVPAEGPKGAANATSNIPVPPPPPPPPLSMCISTSGLPPKPTGPHKSPTTPTPTPTTPSFAGHSTQTVAAPKEPVQQDMLSRLPSVLKDRLEQGVQLKHVPRTPSGNIMRRKPSPAIVTPEDYLFRALRSKFKNAHDDLHVGNVRGAGSTSVNGPVIEESDDESIPSRRSLSGSSSSSTTLGLSAVGITAGNPFQPPSHDGDDESGGDDDEGETEAEHLIAWQKRYNEPLPADDVPFVEIFDPSLEVIQEESSEESEDVVQQGSENANAVPMHLDAVNQNHVMPSEAALMA
ncbi:hypothetical protein SeLEV6574_g03608 [Synchytrium endobioticum]|uniref:Uncharacterized protein n=1 Tax=Synchytrium endobioticum TaxID=286115 RepID=A0A507D3K2_9FUNG|nr:hypothetical protein SeLEV6574_g03608 [Synchytrium endobioticum]